MSKKKLIFIHNADFSVPVGNKSQVISMCNAFSQNNVDVTLLGTKSKEFNFKDLYKLDKKVKVILVKSNHNYYIRSIQLTRKFSSLKNNNYNFIFTRDLLFAFFSKSKHTLYEVHNVYKKKIWLGLLKLVFKKTRYTISISNGIKEDLVKLGFDEAKIIVLHDGVDLQRFDIKISKGDARKKLKLKKEEFIISYVGNTEEKRDLPNLIEVCKDLNLTLLIYGKDQDYLKAANKRYKNIHFKGYTSDAETIYKASDLLFAGFTKKIETINYMSPLKLFEYMGSNTPILVSDFERVREVVNEKEVYFYESENKKDLKEKIELIMKNNSDAKSRAKKAFIKSKNHTWKNRAKDILNLF